MLDVSGHIILVLWPRRESRLDTHTKALLTILSHHPVAREMPVYIRLLYIMPTPSSFLQINCLELYFIKITKHPLVSILVFNSTYQMLTGL